MVFLFLEKWKLFKGKLVEKQGRKARRGHRQILAGVLFVCQNGYENWQGQVLCIQIKAG